MAADLLDSSVSTFKIRAEEPGNIALNILAPDGASVVGEQPIPICEDGGQNRPSVLPFINHLLQNAGVRMLWDKAGSEHFNTFPSNFFYDRRIVEEPPASER